MAEYLSLGPVDPNTAMWLRDAAGRQDKLPTIEELDNPKYFPYRWGQAFWAYVGGRWGDDVVRADARRSPRQPATSSGASRTCSASSTKELSKEWHAAIRRAYEPVLHATTPPDELGPAGDQGRRAGQRSQRRAGDQPRRPLDRVPVRARASSRSISSSPTRPPAQSLRKLTSTATDPALLEHPVHLLGGRVGRATASASRSRPSAPAGRRWRSSTSRSAARSARSEIRTVDEIFNPTWAPDGQAIAFTGMSGGLTDLYVYDLGRRDAAAADQRRVRRSAAGVVARRTTDRVRHRSLLDQSRHARHRRLPAGAHRRRERADRAGAGVPERQEHQPAVVARRHARCSSSPIATASRTCIRVDARERRRSRSSRTSGPASAASPARVRRMSVAARAGIASFSVYEGGKYNIYVVDAARARGARRRIGVDERRHAAAARSTAERRRRAARRRDARAARAPHRAPSTAYKPKLSLEGVGQPAIGGRRRVGSAPPLAAASRSRSATCSATTRSPRAVQFSSGLDRQLQRKGHRPRRSAYFNQDAPVELGRHRRADAVPERRLPERRSAHAARRARRRSIRRIIYRQTERAASGVVAYPFNRARRLEFRAASPGSRSIRSCRRTAYS